MKDMLAVWAQLTHRDMAAAVEHLKGVFETKEQNLGKLHHPDVQPLEEDKTGEVDPVVAYCMKVAYHTAVRHNRVESQLVDMLPENYRVLHRNDEKLEFHIFDHCIHVHSFGGVPTGNKELAGHILDHEAVHNCNLTVMEYPL